ncbi:MAG: EVE domain-containing protein [Deinococcota bacterium]
MTKSLEETAKPYAWLLKTEPDVYSFDDMLAEPKQTTPWDGVRNYQARNFMRDSMQVDDPVLIYHSNCKPPGIVGLARVASEAYPDATQFEEDGKYFDPKASPDKPRWILVDVQAVRKFSVYVPLNTLKEDARLAEMPLVKRGNRLSVIPISKAQFEVVVELAGG